MPRDSLDLPAFAEVVSSVWQSMMWAGQAPSGQWWSQVNQVILFKALSIIPNILILNIASLSPLTFACQRRPSWSWVFRGLSSSPSTGCWVAVFGIGGRKMSTLSTDRLGLMLQASSIAATLYLRAPSWTPTLDFLTTWINIISRIIHKQNYKPKVGPSCLGRCPPWRTTRGNSPKHWWVVVVEMLLPLLVWYWYVIAVIYLVFFYSSIWHNLTKLYLDFSNRQYLSLSFY